MDSRIARQIGRIGIPFQLAFVPQDFDAALEFWTGQMGVGPFFLIPHIPVTEVRYRGKVARIDYSVAIAYWKDTQIELFKLHDDEPSIFREFHERKNENVHHVCVEVENLQDATRELIEAGGDLIQELAAGEARAVYIDIGRSFPIIELTALPPDFKKVFKKMHTAARNWDGQHPLRNFMDD